MKAHSRDFRAITLAERTRWGLGLVLIKDSFTPAKWHEGGQPYLWPTWASWAQTYAAVRDAYLGHYYQRHGPDERPGSEYLYAAFERGENPGDVIVPMPPDPRRLLAVQPRR